MHDTYSTIYIIMTHKEALPACLQWKLLFTLLYNYYNIISVCVFDDCISQMSTALQIYLCCLNVKRFLSSV